MSIINKVTYGDRVLIKGKIENPDGSTANIVVKREDGKELKPGKKELRITASVDSNGDYEEDFSVDDDWELYKTPNKNDKLIATVGYKGETKESTALELYPKPQIIVDFRRDSGYDASYGFDYFRDHRDGAQDYDKVFKGTMATLKSDYNVKRYPWFDTKFSWDKDTKGNQRKYLESYLALFPNKSTKLSIVMDVHEIALEPLELEFDDTKLEVTPKTLPNLGKGLNKSLPDEITVKVKEFSTNEKIKVKSKGRELGVINIMPNSKSNRYVLDVVFINVTSDIKSSGRRRTGSSAGRDAEFTKYCKQAFINPNFETLTLDLSKDVTFNTLINVIQTAGETVAGNNNFFNHINDKLYNKYDKLKKDYRKHIKIYYIKEERNTPGIGNLYGQAKATPSKEVIVLEIGFTNNTTEHEGFHALGLKHPFEGSGKNNFTLKKTDNIMDYSLLTMPILSTWKWQWNILQSNSEKEL